MEDFDPKIGRLHKEETVLPNNIHRVHYTQFGRIPDLEPILAINTPEDGRYVYCTAWLDDQGIGHVYLAWKEEG